MSGLFDINALECSVYPACPLYDPTPFFASVFIIINYYPLFFDVSLWVITIYAWEFFFSYLSLAVLIDLLISYALRYIILSPQRFPNCGPNYGMPAYSSELMLLLNTMGICYIILWNRKISLVKIGILNLVTMVVILSRVYVGYNTNAEIIVGALIGTVEGFFYSIILYKFRSFFGKIARSELFETFGVVDSMLGFTGQKK